MAVEARPANESLLEVWQQSVKSAKAAEEASRQLMELPGRAQALETKTSFYDRNSAKSLKHAMTPLVLPTGKVDRQNCSNFGFGYVKMSRPRSSEKRR